MEWLANLIQILKQMLIETEVLRQGIFDPMFTINGTQYSAIGICTPLALIIILEYTFVRWLIW